MITEQYPKSAFSGQGRIIENDFYNRLSAIESLWNELVIPKEFRKDFSETFLSEYSQSNYINVKKALY